MFVCLTEKRSRVISLYSRQKSRKTHNSKPDVSQSSNGSWSMKAPEGKGTVRSFCAFAKTSIRENCWSAL